MSTIRRPVGAQPPSVYWRRRAMVLAGLVAVIVVIVLIVVRPGGAASTPTAEPTETASAVAEETAAADPDELCDASVLELTPVTDALNYASGERPRLSMTIENTSAVACSYDPNEVEYLITSGADRIWSSADCAEASDADPVVLAPGEAQPGDTVRWNRTRSSADSCGTTGSKVVAGGASYHLSVIVGDAESASTQQFVLA